MEVQVDYWTSELNNARRKDTNILRLSQVAGHGLGEVRITPTFAFARLAYQPRSKNDIWREVTDILSEEVGFRRPAEHKLDRGVLGVFHLRLELQKGRHNIRAMHSHNKGYLALEGGK